MILTLIEVVVFLVCLSLLTIKKDNKVLVDYLPEFCGVATAFGFLISTALILLSIAMYFDNHSYSTISRNRTELISECELYSVALEQGTYDDAPFEVKKIFYQKVEEYNKEVERLQTIPYDAWVGIIHPDCYQDLEILPLPFGGEGDWSQSG